VLQTALEGMYKFVGAKLKCPYFLNNSPERFAENKSA